ncbi:heparinase II/III domain-containing protein [Salinicoccus roseus]|uniref:heparinase II/III domain-containing protein n=1 Tax=Salinicoccus roseus TaxID=45670 RepID=UPI000FBBA275|nr:heparinase II/III family protein [Salinicoccus roseus]RPE54810.1 heparinase II/III-like protein [Salinicoccus roseus]GGA62478.1 hypothetical protein GCM10007176_03610 [Salinicoccus roseus]
MNEPMKEEPLKVTETDVFRLLKVTKDTKKIADKALENTIIPFPGFDTVKFSEDYWETDRKAKYGDSYQLYIQSLRVCGVLMNQFESTKDGRYLEKAEEIIESWIAFSMKDTEERMVWYDHPTANRTQIIIQYLYLAIQEDRSPDLVLYTNVLKRHAEVLSDGNNYNNNNHGLMMDRSLMVLGNVLQNASLFNIGYYRAIDTFWYSFSSQGIHLENSPDYHNMVVRMYRDIEKYLQESTGKSFGNTITGYLKLAQEYPKALLKPNGRLPAIGDSGNSTLKLAKSYRQLYDEEAGICVLQQEAPKPFYMTYVCGYSSSVHKHKDDLSITLNYNGVDFLVDAGKYNYSKSKERKYMTSRAAHSSFQMKDFDYSIKKSNRFDRKIKLDGYYENEIYTLTKGFHGDWNGSNAVLIRYIIVFKAQPFAIIVDAVDTRVKHDLKLMQHFNLDAKIDVKSRENGFLLTGDGESLCIEQVFKTDEKHIVEGDFNKPVAINTTGFGKAEKTHQLRFEKATNQRNVFCTLIYDPEILDQPSVELSGRILRTNTEEGPIEIHL